MNLNTREIQESPLYQGEDEEIAYTLTTTPWGSDPSSPSVVLKDDADTDVSADHLTGDPSVDGDVVTTPVVSDLVAGQRYRLEIKFTIDSNVLEAWATVHGRN